MNYEQIAIIALMISGVLLVGAVIGAIVMWVEWKRMVGVPRLRIKKLSQEAEDLLAMD